MHEILGANATDMAHVMHDMSLIACIIGAPNDALSMLHASIVALIILRIIVCHMMCVAAINALTWCTFMCLMRAILCAM